MYADELLVPWFTSLVEDLPSVRLFDAHSHIGRNDPDGFACAPEELLDALAAADSRTVVFPMQEPDGYRAANDEVIAAARDSGGRLVPFCRLDPHDDPVAEAERCLAAGARGIKLHPRAERFSLADRAVLDVFALAAERRLPVIVHAGRGIPALGRHAVELAERFPGARPILAHAAISDLAWIWREAPEHPNLFYDTAWWSPVDLIALFALVPPGQILYASDTPYGTPLQTAILTLRCALEAGLSEEQVVSVAGAQLERLLGGEDTLDLGPAPGGTEAPVDLLLERVHALLNTAIGRIMAGDSAEEAIGLARLACEVGDDAPQAEVCRSIVALLDRHDRNLPAARRFAEEHGGEGQHFPGLHLVVTAAGVARTPTVRVPPAPEAVGVGERSR